MQSEIRRIAPGRAAIIVAVLHATVMALMTLFMFPVLSLIPTPDPQPGQPDPAGMFQMFRWLLLFYPVFGFVFGWLFGFSVAAAYNVVQRWTGGFLLDIEAEESATS